MSRPFVAYYTVRFRDDKIAFIAEDAVNFDEATWGENRSKLLSWADSIHPELNLDHFINVQTKSGAERLLEAIRLYENRLKDQ